MANDKEKADPEIEQMRKLSVFHKLIRTILIKHWIPLLMLFLSSLAAGVFLLAWETRMSPIRFETHVNLLYFPKKSNKIPSLDDRNLMQIFTRNLMFLKLRGELHLDHVDVNDLISSIDVIQNRRQTNSYTIIVRDNQAEGAIRKANTFADLCIREYIAFRSEDLKKHQEVILQRKNTMQDSLRKLQQEEAALCAEVLVSTPADELGRLQKISSDLGTALAETGIQLANEQMKLKGIQTLLKDVDPRIFLHIRKIKEFLAKLEKLDHELLSARQLYTDLNPRLQAMETHRNAIAREYADFLKRHSIGKVNQDTLGSLENLHLESLKSGERILQLKERQGALTRALQHNQQQTERIRKVIPDFKNIEDRRRVVQELFRMNEEILSELAFLQASLPNELTQVERSSSVVGKSLFARKNIIFALTAAILLSGLLTALIISIDLIFGKVSGWQELALYPELHMLGFLPTRLDSLPSRDMVNGMLDSLYYHFQSICAGDRIIFFCCLSGGTQSAEAEERLEWNCSLSGRKLFRLKITSSHVSERENLALMQEISFCPGDTGFLQVENVYVLRSPELRLLQNILEKLQREYDLIIIRRDEPLRRNSIFLRQMAQFCDSAVLFIGAGSTYRSILRKLVSFAENNKMTIMTIVSGENDMKPLTQREYYDV